MNLDVRAIPVPITKGGTGQTSQTPAFDALSPLTSAGDLLTHDGADNIRLAKGTGGQFLKMNAGATAPEWGTQGYPIALYLANGNYTGLDGLTRYFGVSGVAQTGTDRFIRVPVPKTGRITRVDWQVMVVSLGSNESSTGYIRINGATDLQVSTAIKHDAVNTAYTLTGANQAVTAGDDIQGKIVIATHATEPSSIFYAITVWVEVP